MIVEKIIVKIKDYTLVNNIYTKCFINFSAQCVQIHSIPKITNNPEILKSSKS